MKRSFISIRPFAGFTLIEVMLAMLITTFVAMLAYSGLSTAIIAAEGHEEQAQQIADIQLPLACLLYTSPSPRDRTRSRMPSSA